MRIALATTSYPRDAGDPSGHFVRAHARALARGGADVVVFAPGSVVRSSDDDAETVGVGTVRVLRTGGEALFAWPGAAARGRERPVRLAVAPLVALRARRAIRRAGPFDRAVAHWMPCAELFAGLDLPLLVVAHGADVRLLLALPALIRAALVRRLLERDVHIQLVARALQDALAAALPADLAESLAQRSFVEAAPFELPEPAALPDPRQRLGLREGDAYVAWLGRLVPAKRPELAIAAARLSGRTLVVVGDGPLYDTLVAAAPPGVVLAGLLPRDRAIAVMRAASVVLHTSSTEGASTVIREARALGVPVVACAAGDLAAWAARDAGIAMAEPDAAAIARALDQAVSSARTIAHHGANQ